MRKRRYAGVAVFFGLCVMIVIAVCFFVPVRLIIDVSPEKANHFEEITKDDVTVYPSALFRRGEKTNNFRFVKDSAEEYDDIVIATTFLTRRIHMRALNVTSLSASYSGTAVEGDPIVKSRITVTVKFQNGREENVKDITIFGGAGKKISRSELITVGTKYGVCPINFSFNEPVRLAATYDEVPYEGGRFNMKAVKVKYVYEDGTEEYVTPISCEGAPTFTGISTYVVYTPKGRVTLAITPVRIKYMESKGTHYAHETLSGDVVVLYDDNTEKLIDISDLQFTNKKEPVLSTGVNRLPVLWNGTECSLYAFAYRPNNVTDVLLTAKDEINASIYNSLTSTFFMTIRKIESEIPYTLTHIVIATPEQIRVTAANGVLGSLESPESAAVRTGWALGINGSFFGLNNYPLDGCLIRDGVLVSGGQTTGHEICITDKGAIFSPPAGVPAESLLEVGVRDVLITTDPLLIQDGAIYGEGNMDITGYYPRTAIGMVTPGEYYIVTAEGNGLTYSQLQSIFSDLECSFARSLDGGSSVSLMFGQQKLTSGDRPVADFLYFLPG